MESFHHKTLTAGGWHTLTLKEQMGNIGSEIHRAYTWRGKDKDRFDSAVEKALELFDLTLDDHRLHGRLREIARAREVFCDAILGGREYKSTLQDLDRYFFLFALSARKKLEV